MRLWLVLGSPRGRLRAALKRAAEAEARLRVLSLDCYLRPAAEVPQANGGANWTHSDAIDFERLRVDLRVWNDPGCEILVLADDRVCGCRELLHDAEEIVLCSSSEPGCFQDCVLSRVTLQDYSARIWPTYRDRAKEFLRMSAELSLTKKLRILDEDAFRQEVLASDFADTFFGQLLDAKNVPKATQADLKRWGARVDVCPPERNQRTFQQLRKEVLYPIEAEAKRFAVKVLRLLKPEPSKALQEILNYRLSIRAMSKEERAKWSSVLCTRELGPSGEILSVEMLRWAWRSLKDLPPMDADDLPRADLVLALSPPCGEELIPFASLLESSAKGLEPICLAVDTVIDFGRLHFLRQRMWDASPEVTLDLARRLLEHKHWLLKALGTRFAGQLLDADAPRYQVCFRDLTQHGGVPFAQTLAQALLCLSAPLTEESHVEDTESSSAVAFSSGAWRSVQIRCRRGGEGGGEVLVAVDGKEQWLPSYWVRASTPGHDYWQRLREWWLVDPFALRKLLDRAPDHCSKCLEASLAQPLAERLSAALRSGALGLAAELAASLLRLARYGASSANSDATSSSASAARAGTLMKDLQLLVASLSDLGIEQGLAEAMALLALMARSKNVAATLERAVEDSGESNAPAFAAPPAFAPASASASEFRLREATEDPGRRVLELMQLKEQLKLSDQRQAQLQEDSRRKEAEVQRCRDAMALLLEEKKTLAQRVADLELTRAAAVSAASAPPALPMGAEADVEAEEDDWVLKADVESLSEADAQSFVARLAKRRDSVTALRSSLCGALRQLGENLYTSSVHFVDELLQNADDCSYLQEPSFRLTVTADQAHFFYNERGFRPKDVLSLCSLAVSTKSGDEFLGHKGVGFKSVFACSNTPSICSGKFRFKFEVPGPDELAYITPRWLEPCAFATHEGDGTHILLPFRPELVGDAEFLQKLEAAFDPLVLLGLSRLRHLAFEGDALKLSAHLTKGPEESFLEVATFSCCLRTANSKRLFRVFASADGRLRLAFPELPGPELPVCAGLPCAHVGHKFLLQGKWQLTTSREAVRENAFNAQLRAEAAKLFTVAARHHEVKPHLAAFLPSTGPGTPPFWQAFAEEVICELRAVLPDLGLTASSAALRLPDARVLALVTAETFQAAGLQVVQDETLQVVLEKCGVRALAVEDIFLAERMEEKSAAWWAELFQLLLDNSGKPGIDDIAKTQRLWSLRGHAGRRAIVGDPVVFCSVPSSLQPWRPEVAILDTASAAELRFALTHVAHAWDGGFGFARKVLRLHLDFRKGNQEMASEHLWADLRFLRRSFRSDELQLLCGDAFDASLGEVALVPVHGPEAKAAAQLATVPTVAGCRVPLEPGVLAVALPYDSEAQAEDPIEWEEFLLRLGCQPPKADLRTAVESPVLPALEQLPIAKLHAVLSALPPRTLQWLQEKVVMMARSGRAVALNNLVAEQLLRSLPLPLEQLELVPVPPETQEVAQLLGICVRQNAEMCWFILAALCAQQVRSLGPYIENLAMLQSLGAEGPTASSPVLFLPDAAESESGAFCGLGEVYVCSDLDEGDLSFGFQELRRCLARGVISCRQNVAYWSFAQDLRRFGCSARPSCADAALALRTAAAERRNRRALGQRDLLSDRGLEVMLSLYQLLDHVLATDSNRSIRSWTERLAEAPRGDLELPLVTWEGAVARGEGAEVRACRSTWLIDSMLAQNAEVLFVHVDIAERCPHVVSAMGWPYLEADAQILWHQSNNNPEYELAEVSAAFSEVLQRSIQVVSCNWIALEVIFTPGREPIRGRLRAQPSFALLGGVLALATHFVREAGAKAALAAGALAQLLALENFSKEEAEVTARRTCEGIRSFSSERYWEGDGFSGPNGVRQTPAVEVILPSGIEEATLPGLMGSFGGVEQYEDQDRFFMPALDRRRDQELFGDVISRILSQPPGAASRSGGFGGGSGAVNVAELKEQQRLVGQRAEHFYSCFLAQVFGDAYKPSRDWVSSARLSVFPGTRGTDDAAGFDFMIVDTAQHIAPSQGKKSTRCFIEVKGCSGAFDGTFCLSANEQRKRDQVAAIKSEANAYVIAVVDNMDTLEMASIRHFLWSELPQLLRLEPDSFLATVDVASGQVVSRSSSQALRREEPAHPQPREPARPEPRLEPRRPQRWEREEGKGQGKKANVNIPASKAGLIIGKGGSTVKWMMEESGAHIQVEGAASGLASVGISGTKEQIAWAKQLIQEAVYGEAPRSGRAWKSGSWQ